MIGDICCDIKPLDLRLGVIDEIDGQPVPLFVEKLGSLIRDLVLPLCVVDIHVPLLDDLADVEVTQSNVFSTRAVGLGSGYM